MIRSIPFRNAFSPRTLFRLRNLPRGISSVRPTPKPFNAASPRSARVASAARALSLASPAPAPAARAAAAGMPAPGIREVSPSPAKEPRASPNLRPTSSSDPASAVKGDLSVLATDLMPALTGSSDSSSSNAAAPRAPNSPSPIMPAGMPLASSSI